jgi:hypothetical protein
MNPLPLSAARVLALHAQGLDTPPGSEPAPTLDTIYNTVERLTCVQIDTLHMVQRSQYLVMWSRLGKYDPADFDRLIYDPDERRLFEYWQHAASIIPLKEYRYRLPQMEASRNGSGGWWKQWRSNPDNVELTRQVLERIRLEGKQRVSDFEYNGDRRGAWWDWKPAKQALEFLYDQGELMIADRVNFHRVYDLRERVLPDWVDSSIPTMEEMRRHFLERAARALGIARVKQIPDYAYMKIGESTPSLKELLETGVLVEMPGELADGNTVPLIVHRDNLPLVEQAADGSLQAARTTFLSPFDSLFWARERDEQFWNFRQRLEAYTPAPKRKWGYFCLAILHRDRLVGRFDPKLERKNGTLRLKALYLEPGIEPAEELIADVAGAMRDFLAFHKAQNLIIERSDPSAFGEKLLAAL